MLRSDRNIREQKKAGVGKPTPATVIATQENY